MVGGGGGLIPEAESDGFTALFPACRRILEQVHQEALQRDVQSSASIRIQGLPRVKILNVFEDQTEQHGGVEKGGEPRRRHGDHRRLVVQGRQRLLVVVRRVANGARAVAGLHGGEVNLVGVDAEVHEPNQTLSQTSLGDGARPSRSRRGTCRGC